MMSMPTLPEPDRPEPAVLEVLSTLAVVRNGLNSLSRSLPSPLLPAERLLHVATAAESTRRFLDELVLGEHAEISTGPFPPGEEIPGPADPLRRVIQLITVIGDLREVLFRIRTDTDHPPTQRLAEALLRGLERSNWVVLPYDIRSREHFPMLRGFRLVAAVKPARFPRARAGGSLACLPDGACISVGKPGVSSLRFGQRTLALIFHAKGIGHPTSRMEFPRPAPPGWERPEWPVLTVLGRLAAVRKGLATLMVPDDLESVVVDTSLLLGRLLENAVAATRVEELPMREDIPGPDDPLKRAVQLMAVIEDCREDLFRMRIDGETRDLANQVLGDLARRTCVLLPYDARPPGALEALGIRLAAVVRPSRWPYGRTVGGRIALLPRDMCAILVEPGLSSLVRGGEEYARIVHPNGVGSRGSYVEVTRRSEHPGR